MPLLPPNPLLARPMSMHLRLLLILLLLLPLPLLADERADLHAAAIRLHKDVTPPRIADVLAIARTLGAVPPLEVVRAQTPVAQKWLKNQKKLGMTQVFIRHLLVEAAMRAGDTRTLQQWQDKRGLVTAWRWLGPFGNEHGSAFTRQAAVEQEKLPVQQTWPGRGGRVSWQVLPPGLLEPTGRVHLEELVERPDDAIVFAETWLKTPLPVDAVLRLATLGPTRVYLDGVLLAEIPARAETFGIAPSVPELPDVPVAQVRLPAGVHRLLVKLAPSAGELPLRASWTTQNGLPLDLQTTATPPDPLPLPLPLEVTAALLPDPLGALGLQWPPDLPPRKPSPLPVLVALAWHSWPLHPELIERLLAADPTDLPQESAVAVGHALLAGELGDRIDRLGQWTELLPQSVDLLLARAEALDAMGKTPLAHRLLEEWQTQTGKAVETERVRGCVLRAALWTRLGGDVAATELLETCGNHWPDAPELLEARIRDAVAGDNLQRAVDLHRRLVELEPGRLDRHSAYLNALVDADRVPEALEQADRQARLFPDRSRGWEIVARLHLAQKQPELALAALHKLPKHLEQASTLELKARTLLALKEPVQEAAAVLKQAIEKAPARTDLRMRLGLLQPKGEFYAPYRLNLLELAQKERGQDRHVPSEERLQKTVIQAVGNGQQARYEALVRYLGPGCEATQQIEIEYAPTLTRADVLQAALVHADGRVEPCTHQEVDQFGEDASGMYFDLERITLQFQNLRPGDAIVVEHVERDLAPTPFGLVFGELITLGDTRPVRETDVVMLLPEGTPVFSQVVDPRPGQPALPQMGHRLVQAADRHDQGAWEEYRLQLGPLAAVTNVANMPGLTDALPYLHVSTFADWPALATWWRQLAAEALPTPGTDPVVHAEALRLTAGLQTDEEKVRALFAYVTTQVRYVGLEFGIHSLKPHAVREVLQRAFGDCKDKATLLVALLAELGIDAQVALTRTADNGRLHDKIASLGVFNHAIAYVPSLHWWLDATATHHGPLELPVGDAGGVAMRVAMHGDLRGAHPEPLPEAQAEQNLQVGKLEARLGADGSATIELDLALHGIPAAEARSQLWVPTSRREQVEQFLSPRFPGLTVSAVTATGIDPLLDEVRLHVTAQVPNWARQHGEGQLSVQPLRPSQPYVQLYGAPPDRQQPLVLSHTVALDTTTWLVPPPGFGVVGLPPPVEEKLVNADGTELARLNLTAERAADGALTVRTRVRILARTVEVRDLPAFVRWLTSVDNVLRLDVLLHKVKP